MTSSKLVSLLDYENNDEDTPDNQKIYEACTNGSINDIAGCFKHGESAMTGYIKDGMTPLHLVIMAGRSDAETATELLLKNGTDVNALTKAGDDTALHLIIREVDIRQAFPLVLKILEFGPDLNIRNRKLRTPYDLALAHGYFELAQTLDGQMTASQAREFYKQRIGDLYGERLLQAVVNSKEQDIEECCRCGANPNFKNEYKNAPIHYAVTHCSLPPFRTLTSLIHTGADVNLIDDEGDTALNLIIKSARLRESGEMYKCAELLVNHGALSTFADLDGKDAMALATTRQYQDIVSLLGRDRQSHVRESPLPGPSFVEDEFEEEEEEEEEIDLPPAYEAVPTFQLALPQETLLEEEEEEEEELEPEDELYQGDDFVHPPPAPANSQANLLTAIQQGNANAVSAALRDPNADVNKQDDDGIYPLHYAVIREEIEDDERESMIAVLIDAGCDVNVKTKDKLNTPLHIAAIVNQTRTVKQLLGTHKSNYNQRNKQNKTAYDLANFERNRDVMRIIDQHRAAVRDRMRNKAKMASTCTLL